MLATLLRPWTTTRMWRVFVHAMLDIVIGSITFTVMIVFLVTTVALLIVLPLALPFAWMLFASAYGLGAMERSRAAALLDVDLASPHRPLAAWGPFRWIRRLGERAITASRWREIAYLLLLLPMGVVTFAVNTAVWCGSFALVALPLYVSALPGNSAEFGLFDVPAGPQAWLACLVGVLGVVVVAPWVTTACGIAEGAVVRLLLGPARKNELEAEVHRIEASRVRGSSGARSRNGAASSATCTTAPSSGWSRWPWTSAWPVSASTTIRSGPPTPRRGPRGGQAGAHRAARPRAAASTPRSSTDRGLDAALSAVAARSPGAGRSRTSTWRERPTADGREHRLLRGLRGADERRQARRRDRGDGRRSPAAATGSSSTSATTAAAAPTARSAPACRAARPRAGRRRLDADLSPAGGPTTLTGGAPVRIVIAEDSVLLRAGLTRLLVDAGEEVVAAVGDADALIDASTATSPTSSSPTCACRRPTPTRASAPRSRSASQLPDSRPCSCSSSTSRSGTRPSCSPATPRGSATC